MQATKRNPVIAYYWFDSLDKSFRSKRRFSPSKTLSSFSHNLLQAVRPSVQSPENLSPSSGSIPSRDSVSLYFCLCETRWFYSKRNVGCRETIARILHHCYSSFPLADSAAVFFAVSDSRVSFMNPILLSWVASDLWIISLMRHFKHTKWLNFYQAVRCTIASRRYLKGISDVKSM